MVLPVGLFDITLGFLANAVREEKDKLYEDCKKKVMLLFTNNTLVFLEDSKKSFESLQIC